LSFIDIQYCINTIRIWHKPTAKPRILVIPRIL